MEHYRRNDIMLNLVSFPSDDRILLLRSSFSPLLRHKLTAQGCHFFLEVCRADRRRPSSPGTPDGPGGRVRAAPRMCGSTSRRCDDGRPGPPTRNGSWIFISAAGLSSFHPLFSDVSTKNVHCRQVSMNQHKCSSPTYLKQLSSEEKKQ